MRALLATCAAGAVCVCALASPVAAWGDRTHRAINRLAVESLPAGARDYFAPHAHELAERSTEPDALLRAREGKAEAVRHFIDLDALLPPPFTGFPRPYREAVRRFGRRRIERHGLLPWVIVRFQRQVRAALRAGDGAGAVRDAAYLGHYVADAFQPLHLTDNHDGQLTGARGIHRRLEETVADRRIETLSRDARRLLQPARTLADPREVIFESMFRSYDHVETVLRADRAARAAGRPDSRQYDETLAAQLDLLVGRQMAGAASLLGSLWLTAWEQAAAPGRGGAADRRRRG